MSGRLAELDEDAHVPEIDGPPGESADETSTRTVEATPIDDLKRLSLVWRVKMTQIRMMDNRGYELTPLDIEMRENSPTPSLFWDFLTSKIPTLLKPESGGGSKNTSTTALWDLLSQTYNSKKDPQIRNMVVFLPLPAGKAFPTMRLNRIISVVKRDPTLRFLDVIYEFPLTKLNRSKLAVTNRIVAEWSFADLLMPILQSVYVGGNFRVLSPAEFAEEYKTADPSTVRAGLPAICRDDPLARYHQWTPDTVIRSTEVGDVNVAVTRLLKDYIVTSNTIFAAVDSAEQPAS